MKDSDHLDNGLLIQFLDGELSGAVELRAVRAHLAACMECRQKRDTFARLSSEVEKLIAATPVAAGSEARGELWRALVQTDAGERGGQSFTKTIRRFGWGMAVAASLAFGVLVASFFQHGTQPARLSPAQFEVDGETFIAVPYSNPDLPMIAPRIVEMQLSASSLTTAGIFLQPAANGSVDRTVPADVLLGMDGQPLGVHILSGE